MPPRDLMNLKVSVNAQMRWRSLLRDLFTHVACIKPTGAINKSAEKTQNINEKSLIALLTLALQADDKNFWWFACSMHWSLDCRPRKSPPLSDSLQYHRQTSRLPCSPRHWRSRCDSSRPSVCLWARSRMEKLCGTSSENLQRRESRWKLSTSAVNSSHLPPEWLVCCCCMMFPCCETADVVLLRGMESCVHRFDDDLSRSFERAVVSIISAVWCRPQ